MLGKKKVERMIVQDALIFKHMIITYLMQMAMAVSINIERSGLEFSVPLRTCYI